MLRPALILTLSGAVLASGCSSVRDGAAETARMTRVGLGEAVTAPLKDFGLVKAKVPAILQKASTDPYKRPERIDCDYLVYEVTQLDVALGPDVDMPSTDGHATLRTNLVGRGSRAASDAALDAVRDLTTGWIPFRSTVRRLTGAADNQDEIEDAAHAGGLRRAYLKGLGLQMGCPHPAAPLSEEPLKGTVIASQTPAPASTTPAPTEASTPDPASTGADEAPTATAPPAQAAPASAAPAAAVAPGL